MTIDPDTPILVGVGVADQRVDEPGAGDEAADLMATAARAAASDAGPIDLLTRTGWVGVPEGMWEYRDAGRLVAERIGASGAHTVRSDVGVLQQELFTRACDVIASGAAEVALVTGGEAKRRDQIARRAGTVANETPSPTEPDEVLSPKDLGIAPLEMERGLVTPVSAFALIDSAIRHRRGESPDEHRRRISELWAAFARVAADNPHAWDRSMPSAAEIRDPTEQNRMLAFPYTRLLASQWNVDQAGALLFCTVATARRLEIPQDRWVFQHSAAISNHSVPVMARPELDRSPGAAAAGHAALELAGIGADDLDLVDLYSCFPAAVQVFANELGITIDPAPTVTGGMTFAGGPLNNYVVQALVRLATGLRARPTTFGLSSSVSGFLHKQGFSIWSTQPPDSGFRQVDLTDSVAAADVAPSIVAPTAGSRATVVSYTVERTPFGTDRAIAVLELADGSRTLGESADGDLLAQVVADEWIGASVLLDRSGTIVG